MLVAPTLTVSRDGVAEIPVPSDKLEFTFFIVLESKRSASGDEEK